MRTNYNALMGLCLVAGASLATLPILASPGCAATQAQQTMQAPAPASQPAATQPANGAVAAPTQAAQQAGQTNVAGQATAAVETDAHGWKAIEYTSAVPVGQVILMALMLYLSHRREGLRLTAGGAK